MPHTTTCSAHSKDPERQTKSKRVVFQTLLLSATVKILNDSMLQMGTEMPCRMFTLLAADGPSCEILSPHAGEEVQLYA